MLNQQINNIYEIYRSFNLFGQTLWGLIQKTYLPSNDLGGFVQTH